MFDVSISLENNKILGEFVVDSYFFEPSKYHYAFYLCKDDDKVKKQPYSDKMNVVFDLEGMSGTFYIRAFVRDIQQGNKRAYNSADLLVNS